MSNQFWHWPDHTIGKRESRQLREEHNRIANERAELLGVLKDAVTDAEFYLANNLGPKSCVESWLPSARKIIIQSERGQS